MIELVDTFPDVNVQTAEYKRLLGYPRDWVFKGRVRELAEQAREWYAKYGKPWVYARQAADVSLSNGNIVIDGVPFTSSRLQNTLQQADADGVVLVALGAGVEVDEEAQRLWREEKPDEYFFLEMFGSAVVEHLTTMTGARLCSWAESHQMAVLPHYSPGYPKWDISEQRRLLELIQHAGKQPLPSVVEALESGMLRPKKSLLAVFGLTRHTERLRRLTDLIPCENCSYAPCQYRRAPYVRAPQPANGAAPVVTPAPELKRDASYTVNPKALKRWAEERLTLKERGDNTFEALFRYDGTTCSNTGRPLTFHYNVRLGTREEGYPIREQHCAPAPGDTGHTYMCRYMNNAEHLMVAIDRERPLLGRPLNDVLAWKRPECAAGCYCEPAGREHKWGLVLETIHYALAKQERENTRNAQLPVVEAETPARAERP